MDTPELMRVWTDEVWHAGRLERVADCLGETYTRHDAGGTRVVTRAEYTEEIRVVRERIPDIHFWTDDIAVSADRIWTRWRLTGTNAQTSQPVNISALQIYRVEDGRLAETWAAPASDGHGWSAPIE